MAEEKKETTSSPIEWPDRNTSDQPARRTLRDFLGEQYSELRLRLTRRLGSSDWAEEALHDTYLRLDGSEAIAPVNNPGAYLFRAAINNAINRRRAENRRLSPVDIETLLHIADDAPGAHRVLEGRSDLALLKGAMAVLPERQRAILIAARLGELTRQEIADRFGISVSMVEKELKRAQEHCVAAFRRKRSSR
jgi:RNA polymerase sigma-70 factor, ECF subfamily